MADTQTNPGLSWMEAAKFVGAALLIALVLRVVLFQPFTVPSASMQPTLLKGDYMAVSKFSYGWSRFSLPFNPPLGEGRLFYRAPQRGDVIVFSAPKNGRPTDFVKRLIGLPGDRVRLERGVIFINDRPVQRQVLGPAFDPGDPGQVVTRVRETLPDGRSWIVHLRSPDHYGETTGEYVIPADRFFFLGDNRDNSLDSRWPEGIGVGLVPKEALEGKVGVVLLSWRGGATLNPWTWVARLDLSRVLHAVR